MAASRAADRVSDRGVAGARTGAYRKSGTQRKTVEARRGCGATVGTLWVGHMGEHSSLDGANPTINSK